ncbi:DUF2218 domain-containing protein [Deinococcus yavapaiensis]|uniref:DUF2218 domain-containing protein n=1 Tax=Deinococcus yavapaiensis KR-236 TaxID=694435 RepID=A0A318S1E8_9DEIO|nr:DUF2218 domain-containing protein [Deinococcus yavapaiensis]PYE48351.1 hypothetical protein DES52_13121 [Deinococcus yavapaiensis KR-236]
MTLSTDHAFTSRDDVAATAPVRYDKQRLSHLSRKVECVTDGNVHTATGQCTARIVVGNDVLTLLAADQTQVELARIKDALGSHLERFGHYVALTANWDRRNPRPAVAHSADGTSLSVMERTP